MDTISGELEHMVSNSNSSLTALGYITPSNENGSFATISMEMGPQSYEPGDLQELIDQAPPL